MYVLIFCTSTTLFFNYFNFDYYYPDCFLEKRLPRASKYQHQKVHRNHASHVVLKKMENIAFDTMCMFLLHLNHIIYQVR